MLVFKHCKRQGLILILKQVVEFSACILPKERAVGLLLWGGEGGRGGATVIITLRYLQLSSETPSLRYVNILSSPHTIGTIVQYSQYQ